MDITQLITEGDIIFDVGANTGAKTDLFLRKGATVICIEPQPDCIYHLRRKYHNNLRVFIVEKGLADKKGRLQLFLCSNANTISTFSDEWKKGRFANYHWDKALTVEVTTLDEIIRQYGLPKYCKIDVEGFEYHVLKGLSTPIPFISYEFTYEFLDNAKKCLSLLNTIGYKCFNIAIGEEPDFVFSEWVSANLLFEYLSCSTDKLLWGDIFAKYEQIDTSNKMILSNCHETLSQFKATGKWCEGHPLRLHLGCGEQYLQGYVNIDYPPSEHAVMRVKADYYCDITKLNFPDNSIDEIRLHHVFEHFSRVAALALLIRWHRWLKIGGKLWIETPDLEGTAKTLLSDVPWDIKAGVVRHIAGDQSSAWGYHIDHWFPSRFEHTLNKFGFDPIQTQSVTWDIEPYLSNVHAIAVKSRDITSEKLLQTAEALLKESIVSESEMPTYEVWCGHLREMVKQGIELPSFESATSVTNCLIDTLKSVAISGSSLPLYEIHDFNQRNRDRWVQQKAISIPSGSRVLDVGAGTCPYRPLFAHCEYRSQDFKKYQGEKLGGTNEYGQIDYESDISDIPVPDRSFDVILCTEVLEHISFPFEAVREMVRILKPGGRLLLTAPLGSGLHQLPYHFYGGFTPEWYKYAADLHRLTIVEITPNGGFFKLLAQECTRVGSLFDKHKHLHGEHAPEVFKLFFEILPRFLYDLDEKCFIDQFTVGYHVEMIKPLYTTENHTETLLLERLQKNFRDVEALLSLAELEQQRSNLKQAQKYLIAALALEPKNEAAQKLLKSMPH